MLDPIQIGEPHATRSCLFSPIVATLLCGVCTISSALPALLPINPAPVARPAAVTAAATTARATQVQVDDDDAHGAFKEGGQNVCETAGTCAISFSTVATGHRRLVEKVSCAVFIFQPGTLDGVLLNDASYSAPRQFLTITRSFGFGGQYYFGDVSTKFPYEAGETPVIYAQSEQTGVAGMQCTITGRDIVLP